MKVIVYDDDGGQLAEIRIRRVDSTLPDEIAGDYQVRFAVRRGNDMVGMHQRGLVGFFRKKYNALGYVRAVLKLLTDEELELEPGVPPVDTSPRIRGALEISKTEDRR
jgi:hypothetical protein